MKDMTYKDISYFKKLGRQASYDELAKHEQDKTLVPFIAKVAPDFLTICGKHVDVFTLARELKTIE